MSTKIFTDEKGMELIIKNRSSAVIFEVGQHDKGDSYDFIFYFTKEDFFELHDYLSEIAHQSWKDFIPKEAHSMQSDYYEYYDSELDNNGYLRLSYGRVSIERPSDEHNRLYKFNKKKMQSFLFDLNKIVEGWTE